jgi:hypothetical protein
MIGFHAEILVADCSAPRPKKLPITERLCVPVTHSQLARHLNRAASGACSSASRAPNSASTLTPLLIFPALEPVVLVILFLLVVELLAVDRGSTEASQVRWPRRSAIVFRPRHGVKSEVQSHFVVFGLKRPPNVRIDMRAPTSLRLEKASRIS